MSTIDEYLGRFEGALAPIPAAERADLVAEIRDHLTARERAGAADPLAGFAEPESYAADFLAERALAGALERGGSVRLLRALARVGRGATAAARVAGLSLLHLFGLAFLACAAAKVIAPSHAGLFVDDGGHPVRFGFAEVAGGHEVLGWWSLPIFLAAGLVTLWTANRLLRAAVRRTIARLRAGRAS